MVNDEEKAAWRDEFERDGERLVYDMANGKTLGSYPEPKRQYAFEWLRETDKARRDRENKIYWYVQRNFWAAVLAVLVGVIGCLIAWFK
jgi:hypothetical protein